MEQLGLESNQKAMLSEEAKLLACSSKDLFPGSLKLQLPGL
jgi:hypothetical protein